MNLREQWMRKMLAMFAVVLVLAVSFAMPASADIFSGVEAAEDFIQSSILRLLTNVVAPLGASACVAIAVGIGIVIASKHSKGDDPGRLVTGLVVTIIIGALLGAFSIWGPAMLSTTPSSGV